MDKAENDTSRRTFIQTLGAFGAMHLVLPGSARPLTKNPDPPVLYTEAQAFLDMLAAKGGPPLYTLSYDAARAVLEKLQAAPVSKPPADIQEKVFPVGPGGKVAVRIYRPEGMTGTLPAVMYFHGGGWVLGSADTHDRLLRDLTSRSKLAFVFVKYTPSPEAHFPVPIEEAYAATKYVAEHGAEFMLDGSRLAVAGDSVGGNMAAVMTLLAKERSGPAIRFQALFYPVTDASFDTASYREFANGPWLTKPAMKWVWDAYAPNPADRMKITASPLRATVEQLKGLPPGLLLTDANDVLRDEGEAYGDKLIKAGVDVTVQRYLGVFHDFMLLNPIAMLPATQTAIESGAKSLAWALNK